MAFNVRHPISLPAAPLPGISTFAILYLIESFARASIATVIPIQAYDLIKNEQSISFIYTAVGIGALVFSIIIPIIIRSFTRRWTYTLGGICFILTALSLMSYTIEGQIGGMILRVMGTACLNVTLNLYILDHIRKQDYVKNDAARFALSMFAWSAVPYGGIWLYVNYGPAAAFSISAVSSILLIAVFWYYRLSEKNPIKPGKIKPSNPLKSVWRFLEQPRLRLAWVIAFGRSSYWSTFFIYGPILMVASGQGKELGGLLVSVGNATMLTVLLWRPVAEKLKVRKMATISFLVSALLLFCAGFTGGELPLATAAILVVVTIFVVPLDAVGSVPFYRAVHPLERDEMTSVYRTYLDVGELIPPLIYGILLGFFGLGAVFFSLGCLMAACGFMSWYYLNKRL